MDFTLSDLSSSSSNWMQLAQGFHLGGAFQGGAGEGGAAGQIHEVREGGCARYGCDKDGKLRCGRCKIVRYCSRECQRDEWRSHKLICKKVE